MKAYETKLIGTTCIVFADTAPAAKMATVLAARDAGYNPSFSGIMCRRVKYFDGATMANEKPIKAKHCYTREQIQFSND